jgi:poly(beta-D-mannuronate) lyase
MLKNILFLGLFLSLVACQETSNTNKLMVNNADELQDAITNAQPGDNIVMAKGTWKDIKIEFTANGSEGKPITLMAEIPGEVFIEGESNLKFGGEYLVVNGLYFRNGFTPSNAVIDFKLKKSQVANHCRVTNCVIEDYNQLQRDKADHWVEFWGRHNQLDHCYIAGKSNRGPTVRVSIRGNESIKNYHQIVNNHFGPRPRKGGPRGETIQIGDSYTSMSPCNMTVADNLFEKCNGEVEVISSKTNFNEFRNNVFYKCEGSLVMRHGNYCTIDGNYFIGDENNNVGGVRIINTGHWVINNYFYNLKGEVFRSPLAVMNGIPKSPLNRYNQVTDVVVAHNTWVNCVSPWQFGVGTNISQKDVLPLSEIRSARPIRTTVANNIIYNENGDDNPIVAHDETDGITFENNYINNQNTAFGNQEGLEATELQMSKVNDYLFVPVEGQAELELFNGFDFETIVKDLFGNDRSGKNAAGAICKSNSTDPLILDKTNYGADWFSNEKEEVAAQMLTASEEDDLAIIISEANSGAIIELSPGTYTVSTSLNITKKLTLKSKGANNKAKIVYSGPADTPAFKMNPKGDLTLENVVLTGGKENYAFASLKNNMSSLYNLSVTDSEVSDFKYVLKAYKESMSDEITFTGTGFKNCKNGIELSEETNDKGDYNVEFLTIDNCQFENISSNVIDYYRGGYDESTIGGNLSVTNSTFSNCGAGEENGILLNTRGIINVDISKNIFKNNRVKLVALLWGAKNNTHSDNEIVNSGKLIVEENLKLKLLY